SRRLPLLSLLDAEGGASGAYPVTRLFVRGRGAVPLPQGGGAVGRDADHLREPTGRAVEGEPARDGAVAGGDPATGRAGVLRAGVILRKDEGRRRKEDKTRRREEKIGVTHTTKV